MAEDSEYFSSFIDIDKRPSFSSEHEISPENFQKLIGEYKFTEDVICQVKALNSVCHQKHKSGWLGVTTDGFEVLIGGHCARKYFRADKSFTSERKRVRKEIDRKKALHKLKVFRDNTLIINEELSRLRATIINTRIILDQILKSFPNAVLSFITDAQKTRNWDIKIDVLHKFNDDNKPIWVTSSLGNLKSLPYMYEVISLMARAKSLAEKFAEACSLNPEDVSTPKLKRIIETLNDKDDLIKSATSLSQEVARFTDTRNLELLIFVCGNYEEEFLATRAIMAITGAKVSTDGHVNLRLRRIKEKTTKLFDGKLIRKNQIVEKFQRSKAFTS
ncbi:hypothetical protein DRV60_21570 [Salmonella enterica subsp. enterica]|nr:hypothetical protein [Salmonella enterica subsp. enterica serovar Pomona]EAA7440624.1 hypothetical protein [Salmonella enterica subsp. enterica]EBP9900682.1 hypothetical protein [Salmonella enterica]ECE0473707.1 hypothetical protein [Salmonella enterica subsp. enterica serovar Glostrup]EEO9936458.1 hypothetical protein [Salmonella enterica subsp. enterica serovar Sandiego]EHC7479142.1 hypothetical protein [Salmonella enterica subsp. enterica serovar Chomedey]